MKKHNCPFCYTDSSSSLEVLEYDWSSVSSRLLGTFGEFYLCAGLGAIVNPYVIAFPNQHRLSLAEISKDERSDFLDCLDNCLESGLFASKSLCIFEHGGKSHDNTTACIEHCHLHIIDGMHVLSSQLLRYYPDAEQVLINDSECFTADCGYLFAGTYEGDRLLNGYVARTTSCESQFFRRALAKSVGSLYWNWRVSPMPMASLHLLRAWGKTSGDKVAERKSLKAYTCALK